MRFTPYIVTWAVFAVIVLALALYRNLMALHEDDNLHIVESEQPMIRQQMAFHRVMDRIDHWGEALTALTVVGGMAIAIVYAYQVWEMHSRLPGVSSGPVARPAMCSRAIGRERDLHVRKLEIWV